MNEEDPIHLTSLSTFCRCPDDRKEQMSVDIRPGGSWQSRLPERDGGPLTRRLNTRDTDSDLEVERERKGEEFRSCRQWR